MKLFNIMHGVGRVKYLINWYDGISTHKDGSPFFGVFTFSNKKKMEARVKELISAGYKEAQ